MVDETIAQELTVTFNPPLFLQRRGWVFEIMRREGVLTVRVLPYRLPSY